MYIPVECDDMPLVMIDNFLPKDYLDGLFQDIVNLKPHFGAPKWKMLDSGYFSFDPENPINPKCRGEDLWLPEAQEANIPIGNFLSSYTNYILHEGVCYFLQNCCQNPIFNLWDPAYYTMRMHIINYGNGGYYNWHRDLFVSGYNTDNYYTHTQCLYTMALTLVKDASLLKGGEQMFMYRGKTRKFPLVNNQLAIFSSRLYHACSEITSDPNLPWENRRFNIQSWIGNVDHNLKK